MHARVSPALALFRAARAVGVALVVVAGILLALLPSAGGELAAGLRTPIIALEFARSRAEVEALFGPPGSPLRMQLVRSFQLGTWVDFAFPLLYGSFLLLAGLAFARLKGRRSLAVSLLAPFASLCDVLENFQVLAITRSVGGQYEHALARLFICTDHPRRQPAHRRGRGARFNSRA
jgi:hypothetical protein